MFLVLAGDDDNAFLAQAKQYRLADKVQLLTEQIELVALKAVGDASVGLIGSSRYNFAIDTPQNKEFVALVEEGARRQPARHVRGRAVAGDEGAGSGHHQGRRASRPAKLRPALEDLAIVSVKGKVAMRKCDHQGVQQGFMVKVVKKDGFSHPVPEVIATYPGDRTTPPCNKMVYDD